MNILQSIFGSTLIVLISLTIFCAQPPHVFASTDAREKHIIGWIEEVMILPEDVSLPAKIDTGADHSSLNAIHSIEFMKDNEKWIRFSISLKGNETQTLEKRIVRFTRIKRKGAPGQKRPVVLFNLCVGTLYKTNVPVNLADRSKYKYPMLIGRSFLKGSAVVDANLTFTQSPSCMGQ